MATSDSAKNAILERIPRWLTSVAMLLFVLLLIISYITGKRISWSPFGFVSNVVQSIPKGAVIAFADAPTGSVKVKCKNINSGWKSFDSLDGRFVLGAGTVDEIEYKTGIEGGEREVILTIGQMPNHNHEYTDNSYVLGSPIERDKGGGGHGNEPRTTGSRGNSKPHNNMPPYIVLTYCKKT